MYSDYFLTEVTSQGRVMGTYLTITTFPCWERASVAILDNYTIVKNRQLPLEGNTQQLRQMSVLDLSLAECKTAQSIVLILQQAGLWANISTSDL